MEEQMKAQQEELASMKLLLAASNGDGASSIEVVLTVHTNTEDFLNFVESLEDPQIKKAVVSTFVHKFLFVPTFCFQRDYLFLHQENDNV